MRAKFVGRDNVYHDAQSREGLIGTILEEVPYSDNDTKYVYFMPDCWNGSSAITDRKDLVIL